MGIMNESEIMVELLFLPCAEARYWQLLLLMTLYHMPPLFISCRSAKDLTLLMLLEGLLSSQGSLFLLRKTLRYIPYCDALVELINLLI